MVCKNCKYYVGAFGDLGICENKESNFYHWYMLSNSKGCSEIKSMEENSMKTFTKKDLRSGDIVIFRNFKIGVVIPEQNVILIKNDVYAFLGNLTNDLKACYDVQEYDIMKVYRPNSPYQYAISLEMDMDMGTLMYERKEVEEMTLEEICNALGKEIKIVKEK